jgi:hypothetical protein
MTGHPARQRQIRAYSWAGVIGCGERKLLPRMSPRAMKAVMALFITDRVSRATVADCGYHPADRAAAAAQ